MTYEKIFADLKKAIVKADATKLEGQFAFQFCIEGDGEGTFYVEFKDGVLAVEPYNYDDNTATFKAAADTFKKLLTGKTSAADAIASGALVVEGNDASCADIFDFFAAKKPATKKAATTKTAAKKPAEKKTETKKAEAKPAAKKAAAPKATAKKTETKKTEAKPAAKKAEAKPATEKKTTAKKATK